MLPQPERDEGTGPWSVFWVPGGRLCDSWRGGQLTQVGLLWAAVS